MEFATQRSNLRGYVYMGDLATALEVWLRLYLTSACARRLIALPSGVPSRHKNNALHTRVTREEARRGDRSRRL